jgi:tetratricopeptide (TPR) repeat protein
MRARLWPNTILLLLCLCCFPAQNFGAVDEFYEANRLYEGGKYQQAAARYESILKQSGASAPLLFNLGNAYFKNGEIGRAIYNYRRAAKLAPRDPDIQANLRFARDRITGSSSVQPPIWTPLVRYFTQNELSVGAALFFWIYLALLTVSRWRPSFRPALRPYLSIFAVLFLSTIGLLIPAVAQEQVAIVTQSQVPVHLGPLAESQTAFTAPDGTELHIENRRDNWLQVSDRSNRTGWVESSQVAIAP